MRHAYKFFTPVLIVLATIASLLVVAPSATAAEYVPGPLYPPKTIGRYQDVVSGPSGTVTLPCNNLDAGNDLVTYSATGAIVRKLDHTAFLDGVTNCINTPVVDKNNVLYGTTSGKDSNGTYVTGKYLYAFAGNTLRWKYPLECGSDNPSSVVVGANGNIYATARQSDGIHLIGVAPDVTGGATQPAKVLDVKIPNDCSIRLKTYRDGIVVHGQNSGNALYYSYAGKFLGQALIGDIWYEKLNAEGQLFVAKYVTGNSFKSLSISKYDPRFGTVEWTTAASAPGADTNGFTLFPLPDGSVTAQITQQRMTADGLPSVPKEWITTLVTLNANGQKVKSTALSNKDATGNTYDYPRIAVDTGGKLVVVRNTTQATGLDYPPTVSAISVGVYNPSTNTWPYLKVISGDLSKPGGPYGYFFEKGPSLTTDTLALLGICSGNCTGAKGRLFALKVPGTGMEYPRGAVLTANTGPQPAPKLYAALGDSFSSGQGAGMYDNGTTADTNQCFQSANAYGRAFVRDPYSPLVLKTFAACGGSITDNIDKSGTYSSVPKQDSVLTSTTQIITITVGGNDIGFADVVKGCLTHQCNTSIQTARQKLSLLPDKLKRVYNDLLAKTDSSNGGANAHVYVLGYGPLMSTDAPDCPIEDLPFGGENRAKAIALLADLNKVISETVNTVASTIPRIRYIDPMDSNSPFIGHSLCTSEPYFHGINLSELNGSFHPNTKGQKAYADLLAQYLSKMSNP